MEVLLLESFNFILTFFALASTSSLEVEQRYNRSIDSPPMEVGSSVSQVARVLLNVVGKVRETLQKIQKPLIFPEVLGLSMWLKGFVSFILDDRSSQHCY